MKFIFFSGLFLVSIISFSQSIDYSRFEGKNVKIANEVRLNKPRVYDYRVNSKKGIDSIVDSPYKTNIPEKIVTDKHKALFSVSEESKTRNFLKLNYKLTYEYGGATVSVIRFQRVKDSVISKPQSIVIVGKGNVWTEENSSAYNNVKYSMNILSLNLFWEFYNSEENPKTPEINKLKPLVKDANGVLNIEKLAKVIQDNKSALSKYLDQ